MIVLVNNPLTRTPKASGSTPRSAVYVCSKNDQSPRASTASSYLGSWFICPCRCYRESSTRCLLHFLADSGKWKTVCQWLPTMINYPRECIHLGHARFLLSPKELVSWCRLQWGTTYLVWVWLKIKQEGQTAGFGPCFHFPGPPILDFRFFEPRPLSTWGMLVFCFLQKSWFLGVGSKIWLQRSMASLRSAFCGLETLRRISDPCVSFRQRHFSGPSLSGAESQELVPMMPGHRCDSPVNTNQPWFDLVS